MASKEQTPSVVARLMGLDKLPPQRPVNKPCRVLSENYLRKSASIGLLEERSYKERDSLKVKYGKMKELINVVEVTEAPTTGRQGIWSGEWGQAKTSTTEVNIPIERQKLSDAKSLPTNEDLLNSKEFDDVMKELDSDKDLLLSHPQRPDSLFMNHLPDLQFFQPHIKSTHLKALKFSNASYGRKHEIFRMSGRRTSRLNILRSLQKLDGDFVRHHRCGLATDCSPPLMKSQSELKDEKPLSLPKIVVLKENLGNALNSARPSPSSSEEDSLPCDGKCMEFSEKNVELHNQAVARNLLATNKDPSTHGFRVAREHEKCISRQIMHNINSSSRVVSKIIIPPWLSSNAYKNGFRSRYPPSNWSFFERKIKEGLSERWKTTSRCTTLSSMLAMPARETRPRNLNYKLNISGLNKWSRDGEADLANPFGIISSWNGLKEESVEILTRSESLHTGSINSEIPKSRSTTRFVHDDRYLTLEESVRQQQQSQGKNDLRKQNCSKKEISDIGVSIFINKKDQNFSCADSMETQDELENNCGKSDLSRISDLDSIFPSLSINVSSSSLDSEIEAVAETQNVGISFGTPEQQQSEPAACMLSMENGLDSDVLNASGRQYSSTKFHKEPLDSSSCGKIGPEFHMSWGEGYSPSPNSVLELPFSEEKLSGSEFFHGIGAEYLHGLQMQLQLLESESEETKSEDHEMVVSSDEDNGDRSVGLAEDSRKLEGLFQVESRNFSYLVDVLDEAGFQGSNTQMGLEAWQSPCCPVNPSVFDRLEKKYGDQTSWEKSERRLLFELLNLGLKDILQPCMDVFAWGKPLRKRLNLSLSRSVIEEELWMFLVSQEKEASKELAVDGMRWLELWDDIDFIVCEIEKFLFDELAAEIVSIESCMNHS